jgi:hypothetical protein
MPLAKEIYQEFESIVGAEYISDDPSILEAYIYPQMATSLHLGPYYRVYTPRPGAVILPQTTIEVQKIVKLCNKYKLKFKVSSTFWSGMGFIAHPEAIQIDMRRMNKIIEIDRKNCFAVVEPYVTGAILQAEAMKVGLNTHIIGAGSTCSPLASAVSWAGNGPDSVFMSFGGDNMLGLEWVMPNGEILRTGSLGAGLGWFCGEGPGPSARGIVRGGLGLKGAMGVFTKVALKLYPWPGPTKLPVEGTIPAYKAALPNNFRAYTVSYPSWQAWADSAYKIWNNGIGYIAHRQYSMFGRNLKLAMIKILADPTKTLSDIEQLAKDPEVKKQTAEMKFDYEIVLAGMTPRDIEWQDAVLDKILADTGGKKVEAMLDPEIAKWSLLYMLRMGHKALNLVYGGGYDGAFCQFWTPDALALHQESAAQFKSQWEKKGAMVEAGGDCGMGGIGGSLGGGGGTGLENFVHFDPHSKESTEGVLAFFEAAAKFAADNKWPPGLEKLNSLSRGPDGKEVPKDIRENALSHSRQADAFRYQRKFREAFNPNDLGDAYYWTLED